MERTETAATAADLERGRSKIVLDGTNTPMYDPGLRSSSMGTATGGDTTAYAFQPEPTSPITTSHRSQAYKYLLLGVFCLGVFIDVLGVCVFYLLLAPVAHDLDIEFEQQTWVITSFTVTFASFLLFWGRVSDLYSPKPVFCYGFLGLGILNLIISFLTDKYSFLILRAVSGISAAALIPSSYRLITAVFTEEELPRAFTIYSLSGALGASFGVQIGGLVELIPIGGQMSGWRWYFRITTAVIIPVSIWSIKNVPRPQGEEANVQHKWKRLDLVGSLLIFGAILGLILSLTLGASYGWPTASFLVPFIISIILFPAFFFWERRLPATHALIPPVTWTYKNFPLWVALNIFSYAWWTCSQIPVIEVFTEIRGDLPIIAAIRVLPSGIASLLSSIILIRYPIITLKPRYSYTFGIVGGLVGYGLFVANEAQVGVEYWKYFFPGMSLGSFANNIAATCAIVGAMTAAPADQAGVVGAIIQTAVQAGNAVAVSIQAGLMTIYPGGISDFRNIAVSFYFILGWGALWLVLFWVCFRQPPVGDSKRAVAAH